MSPLMQWAEQRFGARKILVVDDDAAPRRILSTFLSKKGGFVVRTAKSGRQALRIAKQDRQDLILLDWMMPGMNGLEVLDRLRETPSTADVPVYMLTGKSLMREVELAFHHGANGYFGKDLSLHDLLKRIQRAILKVKT